MTGSKQVDSPTNPAITYYDGEQSESLDSVQHQNYRSIVGGIMHLESKIRPNLMVTESMLGPNVESLTKKLMIADKRAFDT